MLKNYFIIAWRNFYKGGTASLINIIGLTTGMICFIIISFYVKNELGFDSYHKDASRTYRVVKDFVNEGASVPDATTPPALSYALRTELPEVKAVTRIFPAWGRKYLIQYKDKSFFETNLLRIDSSFFNVFDFQFVHGNGAATFKSPLSIVLTETSAKKYFGNTDPIGQTVRINVNNGQDYLVTGVLKDVPQNSHFSFDFLIPFVSRIDSVINTNWNWSSFYTYTVLKENANAVSFKNKLQPLFNKYQPQSKNRYYAQSLTDIHLKSNLKWELGINNDLSYINILLTIALFVIVIAGINYVNLVTAQSVKRAKEVGVRKVTGASKDSLVIQFLTESVCNAFVSFAIAIIAVYLLSPLINRLLDRSVPIFSTEQWFTWIELTALTLFIGIAAGLYPAFYLSAFRPVKVLKGKFIATGRGARLRKGLVIFQFVISIVLIIGFFTIYRQVDFITRTNLGFDKDNILLLPNVRANGMNNPNVRGSWLDEVKAMPPVINIARADGILGGETSTNGISVNDTHITLNFIRVDHEFLPTLKIDLKEGRNFYNHPSADSASIILNEKAVQELGLKKPYLGQRIEWDDESGKPHPVTIVGIAKDFHFTTLHEAIKPFGFIAEENNGSTFFVKLRSKNLNKDISAIQKIWLKYNPDKPFEYTFQDEQLAKQYQSDMKFKSLFSCVTILAVLIACLGLLGLSIFTTEARRKEIGVRKVLGASTGSLFSLLSKDFLLLVVIAFIIAIPVAWLTMNTWLQSYAYRISMSWWLFIMAGLAAMLIALITISFQAIKAAVANPVKSLRTE